MALHLVAVLFLLFLLVGALAGLDEALLASDVVLVVPVEVLDHAARVNLEKKAKYESE